MNNQQPKMSQSVEENNKQTVVVKEELDEDGEKVQVIYLNVPEGDEPQVLDLSSLLGQDGGLQYVETEEVHEAVQKVIPQETVSENSSSTNNYKMIADQSEVLSANALLRLATSHPQEGEVQVSDAALENRAEPKVVIEHQEDASHAETLLQLSSDPNTSTFLVSDTGEMIPISQVSSTTLLDGTEAEVTTITIRQCWCGQEFLSQSELDEHRRTSHRIKKFETTENKCSICHVLFASQRELYDHQTKAHPGGMPWECHECKRRFSKKIGLKAHMRAHKLATQYQCLTCKKTFQYRTAQVRHMKMHQCDEWFKCTICGEVHKTQWELRKHRMSHQPQKMYQCEICDKTFKQKQTMLIHARIHTGQKPFACEFCPKSFTLRSTLKQHERIHTGEKPNICPICSRGFRQSSTLKSHMKIHTNLKPYLCRYCKMRFSFQSEVLEHENVHIKNKKWNCDDCGMRFRNQSLLARHSRVHSNERPFQCSICNKRFVQSGSLQAHMRSHTKEKPYKCRMCPKAYTTSGTLLIHIRKAHKVNCRKVKDVFPVVSYIEDQKVFTIRTKPPTSDESVMVNMDKPEPEVIAPKPIVEEELNKDDVVAEEIVETQVEEVIPYRQSSITNKDRQEAALGLAELSFQGGEDMHIDRTVVRRVDDVEETKTRTFFKEEEPDENDPGVTKIILSKEGGVMNSQDPHQCPVCQRIFGRKSIMVEHVRIHTDEKPYECDFCQLRFRQNAQLRSHIRNRHTKVERFQCSFCHKRFLSPGITIRHIHFHHKLKVKFCESVDPSWDINSAVWSDDTYDPILKRPQLLSKRKKFVAHKSRNQELDDMMENGSKLVMVDEVNENVGAQEQEVIYEEEERISGGYEEKQENNDRDPVSKAASLANNEVETEEIQSYSVQQGTVRKINSTPLNDDENVTKKDAVSSQTSSTDPVILVHKSETTPESSFDTNMELAEEDNDALDSDLENSKLQCGSCGVPLRGISSLRKHLKAVHDTTLGQSDISYVFVEEETGAEREHLVTKRMKSDANQVEQVVELISGEGAVKQEDIDSIKVVIYDDKDKCVDDPMKKPYACGMCHNGFDSKAELESHMIHHTDEEVETAGLHRCDTCLSVMKNTQQIGKHILKFHGVKQLYVCSICNKEFFQLNSVQRHMKFFHKWEMKIRGEDNIPVVTKAAPLSMQNPTASMKFKKKKNLSRLVGKPGFRVGVKKDGDDVSYISLEVGDLENLKIYRSDGQLVSYDVVNSTDKVKTVKIKQEDVSFNDSYTPLTTSKNLIKSEIDASHDKGNDSASEEAVAGLDIHDGTLTINNEPCDVEMVGENIVKLEREAHCLEELVQTVIDNDKNLIEEPADKELLVLEDYIEYVPAEPEVIQHDRSIKTVDAGEESLVIADTSQTITTEKQTIVRNKTSGNEVIRVETTAADKQVFVIDNSGKTLFAGADISRSEIPETPKASSDVILFSSETSTPISTDKSKIISTVSKLSLPQLSSSEISKVTLKKATTPKASISSSGSNKEIPSVQPSSPSSESSSLSPTAKSSGSARNISIVQSPSGESTTKSPGSPKKFVILDMRKINKVKTKIPSSETKSQILNCNVKMKKVSDVKGTPETVISSDSPDKGKTISVEGELNEETPGVESKVSGNKEIDNKQSNTKSAEKESPKVLLTTVKTMSVADLQKTNDKDSSTHSPRPSRRHKQSDVLVSSDTKQKPSKTPVNTIYTPVSSKVSKRSERTTSKESTKAADSPVPLKQSENQKSENESPLKRAYKSSSETEKKQVGKKFFADFTPKKYPSQPEPVRSSSGRMIIKKKRYDD